MLSRIGWIGHGNASDGGGCGGQWGDPAELSLPSNARGLLLAEGVFETVLVLGGRPQWLAAHLQRWHQGAALLGLASPPELAQVEALLEEAISRSGITTGALRLNWCRGEANRGLQPPDAALDRPDRYRVWLQLQASSPSVEPLRVIISPSEVRQASSLLSRCKSFGYGSALIARRQAITAGADDALLLSSNGDLCCGTSANLLVRSGGHWLTPPSSSGCLGGIMRQRALALKLAHEAPIDASTLQQSDAAVLLNSLGCRAIVAVEQTALGDPHSSRAAQAVAQELWDQLLEPPPSC